MPDARGTRPAADCRGAPDPGGRAETVNDRRDRDRPPRPRFRPAGAGREFPDPFAGRRRDRTPRPRFPARRRPSPLRAAPGRAARRPGSGEVEPGPGRAGRQKPARRTTRSTGDEPGTKVGGAGPRRRREPFRAGLPASSPLRAAATGPALRRVRRREPGPGRAGRQKPARRTTRSTGDEPGTKVGGAGPRRRREPFRAGLPDGRGPPVGGTRSAERGASEDDRGNDHRTNDRRANGA